MNTREVGAPFARRSYGQRVRIEVVLYCVDAEQNRWAFTITDARQNALVRSVAPRRDVAGHPLSVVLDHVELLTGVKIEQRPHGRGFIRVDSQLDVAVRTLDQSSEIGFRSDVL